MDRYLEHDRVYIFENGGDKQVWLSSADWMTRNIDYRIEVATPILDPRLKQRVLDIIDILFSDTVKARFIDKELSNRYVPRGNRRKVQAQLAIYDYINGAMQIIGRRPQAGDRYRRRVNRAGHWRKLRTQAG